MTATIPNAPDPGTSPAYSIYLVTATTSTLVETKTFSGAQITTSVPFCHGQKIPGNYGIAFATSTVYTTVGSSTYSASYSGTVIFSVSVDVTSPALNMPNVTLTKPSSCADTTINYGQANLVSDEAWAVSLQVLKPGATYWTDLTSASGFGAFARSTGLYLCPTDPSGTYGIRATYAISGLGGGTAVRSQVTQSAVVVQDAPATIVPPTTPAAPTVKATMAVKHVGSKVTVSGIVKVASKATSGIKATLQKKVGGHWRTIKVVKSTAHGHLKYAGKIAKHTKIRWLVKATGSNAAATSKTLKV